MWPANAGAVAALMPTGMTDTEGQQLLSNALYEAIFALDTRTLGPAVGYARQQLLANGGCEYEETEQHVHVLRGPGDRAEGAAAAAAVGPYGRAAGRRHGGARLGGGARLRRGRGLRLPPVPASARRAELHAG